MNFIGKIVNNFSIKQKLISLSMVTGTIATMITCGGFLMFNNAAERSDIIGESHLVTKIFAGELGEYIVDNEIGLVIKSLGSLRVRRSIIQACVYAGDDNKEFARFTIDRKRSIPCGEIPLSTGKYELVYDEELGERLIISDYIIHDHKRVGSITIVRNLDRVNARMKRGVINSTILFIGILFICYFISRFLQKTISSPILHLVDVSHEVKNGDYNVRANHLSGDELGLLTEVYNNMLQEIQYAKEHLEEKVIERTKDLEQMMQIKSQFLSNMSHEVRTPVHGIMNYVDFLVDDWEILTPEQKYSFMKKIQNNTTRLLSLINNLLDLSKLDAEKMEFCMQKSDIVPIIEGVVQECEALYAGSKEIAVEFCYNKEISYDAVLDQERISQVIRNLLSNAIKFTPKGKITLNLELVKFKKDNGNKVQGIEFSISDEGIGVPSEELEYIFDKFNQSAITKTGAGGTGLGLSISKEIIKSHQGIIWAENNPNNIGSIFTFVIPVNSSRNKNQSLSNKKGEI
jgi:signal transduction histidine kinase